MNQEAINSCPEEKNSKHAELSREELMEILDYDPQSGIFTYKNSRRSDCNSKQAGSISKKGYLYISIHNKKYKAHRLAWLWYYGKFPKGQLDHIDHNKLNNSIDNLREMSNQENHKNNGIQKNNTSGVPGVHFSKDTGKWIAYIKISGKRKHLGCFTDFEDAVLARKKAEYILGFHPNNGKDTSTYNVGNSNYSKHVIQPWSIILDWDLNYWDGDIIKRTLRTKIEPGMTPQEARKLDYEKIMHICQERINQIDEGYEF